MSPSLRSFDISCVSCGHEETVVREPVFAGHVNNGDVECTACGALDTVEVVEDHLAS